jgi:RHS repeat-associated protein
MQMPGRKYSSSSSYRYGFNGKENDNEIKGGGNSIDFGGRMYDPRVGRWFSVDSKERSYESPYDYTSNNPTNRIDPDGNDDIHFYFRTTATYSRVGDPRRPASCSTQVSYRSTASVEIIKNNGPDKFYHHKQFAKAYTNGGNFSPANGTLISDKVTELQPFSGGRNGFTRSSAAGWPLGFITVADYDNTTLQKYLYNSPSLANYIKGRGLTGNKKTDDGWEQVLKYYKINGILDKAIKISGFIADIATLAAPIKGASAAEYTTIYRTLDAGEMASLSGGKFSFGPNGSLMKQFWLNEESYNAYIKAGGGGFANGYKLEMQVPKSLIGDGKTLNTAVQVDNGIVGEGVNSATVHGEGGLQTLSQQAKNIKITKE